MEILPIDVKERIENDAFKMNFDETIKQIKQKHESVLSKCTNMWAYYCSKNYAFEDFYILVLTKYSWKIIKNTHSNNMT
tara:strand:+ start:703 stop:939 length:237 start_codon:yes stop_codon:yes gene_type:complete